jgi:hypothetical protein
MEIKTKYPLKLGDYYSFLSHSSFLLSKNLPSPIKCQIDPNGKRLIIGAIITMNELDTKIER